MNKTQIFAAGLVAIVAFSMVIGTVEACSCMPRHSQEHFCNSDYVIVARILSRRTVQRGRSMYKIDIKKTYKMSEKAESYLKHGRLYSADNSAMCGINFRLGDLYLIAASSANVGICHYVQPYSQLTIVEKRGFAGGYKKGCECNIEVCFNPEECSRPIGGCSWFGPWINSCESTFGVCVPSRGFRDENDKPTKCHWRRNSHYTDCLRDP